MCRYIVRKGKTILVISSSKRGKFYFVQMSMLLHITIHWSVLHCECIFIPVHGFVTSCFRHLKTCRLTWIMQPLNLLTRFIIHYPKNIITLFTTNFTYWEAVSGRFEFSKIIIFSWELELYNWQQNLPIDFLEVTGWWCSFLRICLHLKLSNQSLPSEFLPTKYAVPWKNWLVQLATQTITGWFPGEKNLCTLYVAEVVYDYFPFHHKEYLEDMKSKTKM